MGVVFTARAQSGRTVAVKVIRPEFAADPGFRLRFKREVDLASRVTNVCTADVLDADPEGDPPYLVTEFVQGSTLDEYVAALGPLSAQHLIGFALALAEALSAIHARGLIHRDLKPSNVILSPDGPRIIDFGIARAADDTAITASGVSLGTPAWMAPEQVRGLDTGPPADVFGWASLAAFASIGRPPFGTGTAEAILYRVVHENPDLKGLDPVLVPLVSSALQKDPKKRPAAAVVVRQLLAASSVETVADAPTEPVVSSYLSKTWRLETLPGLPTKRARGWPTRLRLAAGLITIVALIVGAALGGTYLLRQETGPGSSATEGGTSQPPRVSASPSPTATTPSPSPTPTRTPFDKTAALQAGVRKIRREDYEPTEAKTSMVGRGLWALPAQPVESVQSGTGVYDNRVFFLLGTRLLGPDTAEPRLPHPR